MSWPSGGMEERAFQAEGGSCARMQQWKEQGVFIHGVFWWAVARRQAVGRNGGSYGWVQGLEGDPLGKRQGKYEVPDSILPEHNHDLICLQRPTFSTRAVASISREVEKTFFK